MTQEIENKIHNILVKAFLDGEETQRSYTDYVPELLQLFQTYQAQDRERIARALQDKITTENEFLKKYKVVPEKHKWHNAKKGVLLEVLSIVQGTEEEGDK